MTKFVSTEGLSEHYKVSRQAIHVWRKDPSFPATKLSARNFIYDLEAVEQYFKNKGKK